MGDKIESKRVAVEAGVSTIPGYDGVIRDLDHAIQVCNDVIGYPVLLKAAAGGGGKGMRTCYNDKELREAWDVAKSEASSFFSDDRLLLEKYIENPHHIEFQVLVSGQDVVVFPERECSIQRRNQKVIEESPSVLLKDETRQAMAEQVQKLCLATGYESAGTVEFLVDENQNFYFLEMNTRLQVEHPITEAITGVDLVKGMLWVGAGWGLPPEFDNRDGLIMPYKGHAVEARLYAEDPLRGFLPSTGPLSPYREPSMEDNTPESYLRLDSGVAEGHVVSPYYDPMLGKIVYYAPTRTDAIQGLSKALDEYIIEGVQHNARLVQSVLREPDFVDGKTPTSFLPKHYPDGFKGVQLSDAEKEEYAVAAAIIAGTRQILLDQPPLAGAGDETDVVVRLEGLFGPAYRVSLDRNQAIVYNLDSGDAPRTVVLEESLDFDSNLVEMELDGKSRHIQVLGEQATGEIHLQMCGAIAHVLVQTPREYELSQYMKPPPHVDTSSLVLSPMPGTLIRFAVEEGSVVDDGQELCIVEAMKMQNIIRSPKAGTIAKLKVPVGSSLKADQVILEFEDEPTSNDEGKAAA